MGAVSPLAEAARLKVRAIAQRDSLLSCDETSASSLVSALESDLMARLNQAALSMLVLELGVAAERNLLLGDTPADRYAFFAECLEDQRFALGLLARYPVLARRLLRIIANWKSATEEMLTRLARDRAMLRQAMFSGQDVGALVNVTALGDAHAGGRRVHRLHFASGARLIYKPRPVAMESGAYELIAWLNNRGFDPDLAAAYALDCKDYGWVANLASAPCLDKGAVHRFFRRQGANLALAYVLGATDLHFENVLAVGEHPVIVDWETLFQAIPAGGAKGASGAAAAVIQDSAARTLLLPTRIYGDGERNADIGALGYSDAQEAPFPIVTWLQSGSDEMRSHRSYGALPPGDCLPVLDGQRVPARGFIDDIESGFNDAYVLFQRRKRSLLDEKGPLAVFRGGIARHVFRPTAHYARLLTESWDVRFAQDGALLSAYLHAHLPLGPAAKKSRSVAAAEADAIIAGDIPFFVKHVGGRSAFAPGPRRRRFGLSGNGWLTTRRRIAALSERDRKRQNWIARAAFADPSDELPRNSAKPRRMNDGDLIKLAERLGDRLCETAIVNGKGASWLFPSVGLDRRLTPAVTDSDLYNGLSGIALFLGRLACVTGRRRYFDMTRAAMHEALALHKTRPDGAAVGCGGDAGLAYACALLAQWLERDDWAARARSIVHAAIARAGPELDLMVGRAGLLLGATAVATIIGDVELVARARPLAHALRQLDVRKLPTSEDCGLAHGKAGVGYALARWAQVVADRECLAQAKWLLRTDLKVSANARARRRLGDGPAMLAWCRGGLGATWALLSLGLSPSAVTRAIVDVSTDARPRGQGALCPCHGLLGVTDFLIDARKARTPEAATALRPVQAEVLGRLLSGETCSDHTHKLENPGLFLGVAGAGYLVLRLADPLATPSALMLHHVELADTNRRAA